MNTTELKEYVKKRFRMVRQAPENLSDNELIFAEGKNKEGFEKLQVRLSKSKEELHRIIAALNSSL